MSVAIRPGRLARQPQYAAAIDYAGLAKGVRILLNPGVGPVDLATGRRWAAGGNAIIAAGQNGKAFTFDGEDDFYGYNGYPELTGNIGTFFAWCPVVGPADINGHVLFGTSSPNVSAYEIYPDLRVSVGSNSPSSGILSSWFNTKDRSIVFTSGGTAQTCKVFLDGKETGLTWSGAPAAWGSGNKNFNLGRYVGGALRDFRGTILVAGHTDAVWGTAEARAFGENPWLLFKAPARKWWAAARTTHGLAGADSTQTNNSSPAGVTQGHALIGSQLAQAAMGEAGNIDQNQLLVAAPIAQGNVCGAAAITIGLSLAGSPGDQANTAGTAAIAQLHVLIEDKAWHENSSFTVGITQTHTLLAADITRADTSSSGAIIIVSSGDLIASTLAQHNVAGTGAVTQTQLLAVALPTQANAASTGTIGNGIVVEAALVSAIAPAARVKKPGIPAGTPEWLKTMMETLTGRRGNRLEAPRLRKLRFSATPTREECEALYEYTNKVRDSLEQVITRLDS